MKKVLLFALGLSLAATVSFTSCSDDDPSLTKQFDYASENYTDLLGGVIDPNGAYDPIYGKVKTLEQKSYNPQYWNNTTNRPELSDGDIESKYISEFNKAGFITKTTKYELYNGELKVSSITDVTLDKKNRATYTKEIAYVYSGSTESTSYVRRETTATYNDPNKEATVVAVTYLADGTVSSTDKIVYDLYDNGRINTKSYTIYTRAAGDDMNTPSLSCNFIMEDVDKHKNWTLAYEKYTNHATDAIAVGQCITRTYIYY